MTQDMRAALPSSPRHLGRDTSAFLFSLFCFLIGIVLGYGASLLLFDDTISVVLEGSGAYTGCQLPVEYAVRAATLARSILIETALVWLSAYVSFEKPLLALLFGKRGFSLGAAIVALTLQDGKSLFVLIPFAYTVITAVFLMLTRYIRKEKQNAPLAETSVYALIAGGVASTILLLISLLF